MNFQPEFYYRPGQKYPEFPFDLSVFHQLQGSVVASMLIQNASSFFGKIGGDIYFNPALVLWGNWIKPDRELG